MVKNNFKKTQDYHYNELKRGPIKVYSQELAKWKLNEKQRKLIKLIDEKTITIVTGPAGSSKTFIDCFYAIKEFMNHRYKKIIFSKPIEESGEKLGFLPGDVEDKINPFFESFTTNLIKLVGNNKSLIEKLFEKGIFEYRPLAYMRGASFDDTLMILDEAQNTDLRQQMLFVTRMGKNSKIIISGDTRQYDIRKDVMGLLYFRNMIEDIQDVGTFEFEEEDIMRHPILIEITKRYELSKLKNDIPKNKK